MVEEKREETRVKLMRDLLGERCICLLISELVRGIAEEGIPEGGIPLPDTLRAISKILENLSVTLEDTGRDAGHVGVRSEHTLHRNSVLLLSLLFH